MSNGGEGDLNVIRAFFLATDFTVYTESFPSTWQFRSFQRQSWLILRKLNNAYKYTNLNSLT